MPNEPLITWPDPLLELIGFIVTFLAAGAIGMRFAALGGLLGSPNVALREFAQAAARRAALLGLIGVVVKAGFVCQRLQGMALKRQVTVVALAMSQLPVALQVGLIALAIMGFALAVGGRGIGWWLAAIGVVLLPLRGALLGEFDRLAKPLHEFGGGLWVGTLFLLVVTGLAPALRSRLSSQQRGEFVARMVNGFSPLALCAVALLGFFGVNAAWQELKPLSALWTTPYGWTLIGKLAVVAGVLALGAYNWKRQKPKLGTEEGAIALRGSATAELLLAGVVLLITSVLVSLPSPR